MLSLHTIQIVEVVIGQVQTCANPDQLQMAAIVALVAAVLFGFGGSLMAITAAATTVATTIVPQILAGASITTILATITSIEANASITATIAAALNADFTTTTNAVGLVGTLVTAIKQILGC